MTDLGVLSCRGCLTEVKPAELYSFAWSEIKDLFEECTAISVCNKCPWTTHLFVSLSLSPYSDSRR